MVLVAGQRDSPEAEAALAALCQRYWYPLYYYLRRMGRSPEDAQDLVQGFFVRLLEKKYLGDADRSKGKFRSFLLMALKAFVADEGDKAKAQKRGGGHEIVSLDEESTEMRYRVEPVDRKSPEKAYECRWAMLLLERVLERLEGEFSSSGKARVFEALKTFLTGEKSEKTYAEIVQALGMSEGSLKVTVHRLRARYRELLRDEVAQTVDGAEAIDEEIRYLFAALS